MINKMQFISVAFGGVQSIKSAYNAGVEDRIYIRFMWPGVNGIGTYYPDNLSGYRSHVNTRCKWGSKCLSGHTETCTFSGVFVLGNATIKYSLTSR